MKAKNLGLLLFCIVICSCEGETIDPDKGGRALQLKGEIDGLKTYASGSLWEKDDAIGVYMVKAGESLRSSAIKKNVKYVTSGSSSFAPANEDENIILPFDGSDVDFISYYPYHANIGDFSYPIDLTNQMVQANIDLMYADNATGFNSKNPNVVMQFSHQLSKIALNIVHGKSFDLKDLSVIISNAGTHASFDLATGTLSSPTARGDIELRVDSEGSTAEAILLPETDLSGMHLWFIIGEKAEVYKFSLADAIKINAFEKSTKYTYNVTLFTDETVAIASGNVTGWIDGPSEDVHAEQTEENPPFIKGSKDKPYTVAEAQANGGKTGVWVDGFIVGSFKSSSMGSFTSDVSEASNSNLALADRQDETDISHIIPVQLPTGTIRTSLNLQDNPFNLNKKLIIKGNLESYFGVTGLREPKEYQLVEP